MLFTGKGVEVYQLTAAKYAIAMEYRGVMVGKRRNAWTIAMRKKFKLSRLASHQRVIDTIQKRLNELVPDALDEGGIKP